MRRNASISPEPTSVSSPEIGDTERQQTLHIGPTGVVHKGGGTVPWAKRCALSAAPSPSSKLVFMVLASFVNGPDEAAWPSQSTLATMTGLTARGVRNATKQLEAAGRIRVERMGGDKGIRYCLEAEVSSPSRRKSVPVEAEVSSPEVRTSEGTNKKAAAPLLVPDQEGVDEKPQAETTTAETARHTCPCGHSWPREYGTVCFSCNKPKGSAHNAGLAAPEPGKYDAIEAPGPRGLQAAYADRYRIAHEPEPEEDAIPPSGSRRVLPGPSPPTLAERGVDKKTANEEAPVAKRPWAEPKRTWKFQRVDGSWD